jgi:hypothetical protein
MARDLRRLQQATAAGLGDDARDPGRSGGRTGRAPSDGSSASTMSPPCRSISTSLPEMNSENT